MGLGLELGLGLVVARHPIGDGRQDGAEGDAVARRAYRAVRVRVRVRVRVGVRVRVTVTVTVTVTVRVGLAHLRDGADVDAGRGHRLGEG